MTRSRAPASSASSIAGITPESVSFGQTLENKYASNVDRHLPGGRAHGRDFRSRCASGTRRGQVVCAMAAPAGAMSRSTRAVGGRIKTRASGWTRIKPRENAQGQQVVDLRRGPLRLRLDRRRVAAHRANHPGSGSQPSRPTGTRHSPPSGAALRPTGPRRSASSPRPRCPTRICSLSAGDQLTWRTSTIACRPLPGTRTIS